MVTRRAVEGTQLNTDSSIRLTFIFIFKGTNSNVQHE